MEKFSFAKKMKTKKAVVITLLLAVILGNVIPTYLKAGNMEKELGPNATVYDSLLFERDYVIKTFTTSSFPSDNPYAEYYGVAGLDYMSQDMLERYENDTAFAAGVNVYYTIENTGTVAASAPEALLDFFGTDASWGTFVSGAKTKNYNAVLSKVFSTDYKSTKTGNTLNEEIAEIEAWRELYDASKNIKSVVGNIKDVTDIVNDVNSIHQLEYIQKVLPSFNSDMDDYLEGRKLFFNENGLVRDEAARKYAKLFDVQTEMLYGDVSDEEFNEWKKDLEVNKFAPEFSKFLKVTSTVSSATVSTLQDVIALETMIAHRDTLVDTLKRVQKQAPEDHTFMRTSNRYLKMLENSGIEGDPNILGLLGQEVLNATSGAFANELWNVEKKTANKATAAILAKVTFANSKTTSQVLAKKAEGVSSVLSATTFLGDKVTGFGDVCEKIYELKYLEQIKGYAVKAYEEDHTAYISAKTSGASVEELEILAKKALDDLAFLKRLTLRENEIGYGISVSMADSWESCAVDYFMGYDSREAVDSIYAKMKDALVDTRIDPVRTTPYEVKSGETLTIQKNLDGMIVGIITTGTAGESNYSRKTIPEFQYMVSGGIKSSGTVNIYTDIVINSYEGSGTLTINEGCEVIVNLLDTSAEIGIQGQLTVTRDATIRGKTDTTNGVLKVGGDLSVRGNSGVLAIGSGRAEIGGDLYVNCYKSDDETVKSDYNTQARILMENGEGELYVDGNSWIASLNSSGTKFAKGYFELKGDLHQISGITTLSFGAKDAYEYGWTIEEEFKINFNGDGSQLVDVNSYLVNYGRISGGLGQVTATNGIRVNNSKLAISKLMTDIKMEGDVGLLVVQDWNGKNISVTGSAGLGDNEMTSRNYLIVGEDARQTGNVTVDKGSLLKVGGDLSVRGNSGVLAIESGRAEIGGDLYVNCYKSDDETVKSDYNTQARIFMENGEGELYVGGNSWIASLNSSGTKFAKGYFELKGDLHQISGITTLSFGAKDAYEYGWTIEEEFKINFNGDGSQLVDVNSYLVNYGRISGGLGQVTATNGIRVNNSKLAISKLMTDTTMEGDVDQLIVQDWNGKNISVTGSVGLGDNEMTSGNHLTAGGDVRQSGKVTIDKGSLLKVGRDLSVRGRSVVLTVENGRVEVSGDLYVNCYKSDDELVKSDDYPDARIHMENEEGKLYVGGNSWIASRGFNSTGTYFTKGYFEIKGDLHQVPGTTTGSFGSTDTYKYGWTTGEGFQMIFSGDGTQVVDISDISSYLVGPANTEGGLGQITVQNKIRVNGGKIAASGLLTDVEVEGDVGLLFIQDWNGKNISINGNATTSETTLANGSNLTVSGNLTQAGSMSVNDNVHLTVGGSYALGSQKLNIGEGQVTVGGEFTGSSSSYLIMTSEKADLTLNGNVSYQGYTSGMADGMLHINGGTVSITKEIVKPKILLGGSGSGTVSLSGLQIDRAEVSDNESQWNISIENSTNGYAMTVLEDSSPIGSISYTESGSTLTLMGNSIIEKDISVSSGNMKIENQVEIGGDILLNSNSYYNRLTLSESANVIVNGNVTGSGYNRYKLSTFVVDGKLLVNGNFTGDTYTSLEMIKPTSELTVLGDFSFGSNGNLTDGRILLGGDYSSDLQSKGTVIDYIVNSLTFMQDEMEIPYGEELELELRVNSSSSKGKPVVWQSDNTDIAEISDGRVSAKRTGTAVITATIGGKTASCRINVVQAEPEVNPYFDEILYEGDELPRLKLLDGDTAGSIILDEGQILITGRHKYTWTFIPDDSNYKTITASIFLEVMGPALESIKATEMPKKTCYTEGERFDAAGMIITAIYDNGKEKTVTDYVVRPAILELGDERVIASYAENGVIKTCEISVQVSEKMSQDAGLKAVSVAGIYGSINGNIVECILPADTESISEDLEIVIVPRNENANVMTPETKDGGYTWNFQIRAQDEDIVEDYSVHVSIAESDAGFEESQVSALISIIQQAQRYNLTENIGGEGSDVEQITKELKSELLDYFNTLPGFGEAGYELTDSNLEVVEYISAVSGDADNISGIDGSYTVSVNLPVSKGESREAVVSGKVLSERYKGISNQEALEQAKQMLITCTFETAGTDDLLGETELKQVLAALFNQAVSRNGLDINISEDDLKIVQITAPENGTLSNPKGTEGVASVNIILKKGTSTIFVEQLYVTLPAKKAQIHTLQINCGDNGSVSPSGKVKVLEGDSQTIQITPDKCYRIGKITINDVEHEISDTLVLNDISGNMTIDVLFVPDKNEASIIVDKTIRSKVYGDASFSLGARKTGNGKLVYTVSDSRNILGAEVDNQAVITVDANGYVDIQGTGSAVVIISMAETDTYNAADNQVIQVTIAKKAVSVSDSVNIQYFYLNGSNGNTETYDVASLLPEDKGDTEYNLTVEGEFITDCTVSQEGILSYQVATTGNEGDVGKISVTAVMANYTDAVITVNTILTNKELTGSVSLAGDAVYGGLLTAVGDITTTDPGTLTYTWKRDNEVITDVTGVYYTLAKNDIGKMISVEVSASGCNGILISPAVTIDKANCPAENMPSNGIVNDMQCIDTFMFMGLDSVQYEYSLDEAVTWTDILCIDGIGTIHVGNQAYSVGAVCVRAKETELYKASASLSNAFAFTAGEVLGDDIPEDGIPEGLWVSEVKAYVYTGNAIKPSVHVYDSDVRLVEGKDYIISYRNNVEAYELGDKDAEFDIKKAPSIVIKGKGNYSGTETQTFRIIKKNISESDVEKTFTDAYIVSKNGKNPSIVFSAKYNRKVLKKNKDYGLIIKNSAGNEVDTYAAEGTYILTVKGMGSNYTGEYDLVFEVLDKTPVSKLNIAKLPSVTYDGTEKRPELVIKNGKTALIKDIDYTLSYYNNREVGTATVVITGKGEYFGTRNITFSITGLQMKKVKFTGFKSSFPYTGNPVTQDSVVLRYNNVEILNEGIDYIATYSNHLNAGKVTVTYKGIGNYDGTVKKTYKITPYNLSKDVENRIKIREENITIAYVKGGAKPSITVCDREEVLEEGKDYTLSYQYNTAVTTDAGKKTPVVTIRGKGNYTGTFAQKKTFTITAKDISEVAVTVPDVVASLKAGKYKSIPILTDTDGRKLQAGKDYDKNYSYTYKNKTTVKNKGVNVVRNAGETVDASDIIPANTVLCVIVNAKSGSNYNGVTKSAEYRVVAASISTAKVTVRNPVMNNKNLFIYTGKEIKIDKSNLIVKVGKNTLPADQYEILENTYKNNIKKGTASVQIRGTGDYFGGVKTVHFKIGTKDFQWFWRFFG